MDQIWHRPNLVGPNMAPTKFGWTKNGPDQIWVWTKYGLDQIWARPNMLDQIWSDQKWPTKSVSTKSGLTPFFISKTKTKHSNFLLCTNVYTVIFLSYFSLEIFFEYCLSHYNTSIVHKHTLKIWNGFIKLFG